MTIGNPGQPQGSQAPRSIVLAGFMGTGKSAVGRCLAARQGWPLLDTDALIEAQAGCTIRDIFATRGESVFRAMETECLRHLLARGTVAVISTGGGMVLREENRRLLRQLGTCYVLHAPVEELLRRLAPERYQRPLLSGDDAPARVRHLLLERAEAYAAAGTPVDTMNQTPEEVASMILRLHLAG